MSKLTPTSISASKVEVDIAAVDAIFKNVEYILQEIKSLQARLREFETLIFAVQNQLKDFKRGRAQGKAGNTDVEQKFEDLTFGKDEIATGSKKSKTWFFTKDRKDKAEKGAEAYTRNKEADDNDEEAIWG